MMSPKKLHPFNTFIMFGLFISIIEISPISSFVVPSPQSQSNKYSHIHTAGAGTCFSSSFSSSSSSSSSASSSASSSFSACTGTSVSANVNRNISKKSRIRFRRRRLQLLLDNNNINDSLNDNENININDSINASSNDSSNDSSNHNNHQISLSSSLPQMEEEIIASAKAKLDINRVRNFLSLQSIPDYGDSLVHGYTVMSEADAVTDATDNSIYSQKTLPPAQTQSQLPVQSLSPPPNQLSIALASGCAIATLSLILFHLPILSSLLFLTVTYVASRDPTVENDGLVEGDDISGPITRIVGRATIQSIEQSKPKVKAVARAVISGDEEIMKLRQQIEDLEMENEDLSLWIERRKGVDEKSKLYSLNELKDMARSDGLMVSGTKAQLMMRLMERGSLKL